MKTEVSEDAHQSQRMGIEHRSAECAAVQQQQQQQQAPHWQQQHLHQHQHQRKHQRQLQQRNTVTGAFSSQTSSDGGCYTRNEMMRRRGDVRSKLALVDRTLLADKQLAAKLDCSYANQVQEWRQLWPLTTRSRSSMAKQGRRMLLPLQQRRTRHCRLGRVTSQLRWNALRVTSPKRSGLWPPTRCWLPRGMNVFLCSCLSGRVFSLCFFFPHGWLACFFLSLLIA